MLLWKYEAVTPHTVQIRRQKYKFRATIFVTHETDYTSNCNAFLYVHPCASNVKHDETRCTILLVIYIL